MDRKVFMKFISAAVVTGSMTTILNACKKDDAEDSAPKVDFTLDLTASSNIALTNSGGSVISQQVIVINNNGTYVALSDICTHQTCALSYNKAASKLTCPCHGSAFSLNGSVLNGPASSSLKQYTVTQSGNTLHIQG
jgi:cytochrome b6-f complex iron-sulfur subunit